MITESLKKISEKNGVTDQYFNTPETTEKKVYGQFIENFNSAINDIKAKIESSMSDINEPKLHERIKNIVSQNDKILSDYDKFKPYILDNKYETYKDSIKTLSRILKQLEMKYGDIKAKAKTDDFKTIITDLKKIPDKTSSTSVKKSEIKDILGNIKTKIEGLQKNIPAKISGDELTKYDIAIKNITETLETVKTKITKLSRSSLEKASSVNKLTTESLYSRLWTNYLNDLTSDKMIIEEAQDKLYTAYKNNNLDPRVALALTRDDKVIFIIAIFIVRQITLAITELLIDYDQINNLYNALIAYIGFYIFIILIIVIVVNIDDYKFRILFNFFNMHINQPGIYGHIFTVIGLIILVYVLAKNMYKDIDNTTDGKQKITEIEKMRLIYRLELITIFIFVVTSLLSLAS